MEFVLGTIDDNGMSCVGSTGDTCADVVFLEEEKKHDNIIIMMMMIIIRLGSRIVEGGSDDEII
jgi:hypothetical protein